MLTYPEHIRLPSSVSGSVCGYGEHSQSFGNFHVFLGFYFPFCVMLTMSFCAASRLFRSVWLTWAFSGLCWACTQSQPGICLSQLGNCRPPLLANLCDECFHKRVLLGVGTARFSKLSPFDNPHSMACPNRTLLSPSMEEGTATTAYHRFPLLLPEVQHFVNITVLRLLYAFGQFPKHWDVWVSFVQVYICVLEIGFTSKLLPA